MSTIPKAFFDYLANWALNVGNGKSEEHNLHIQKLLDEFTCYTNLGDFDYTEAVDDVFRDLVDKAVDVETMAIQEEVLKMAASVAGMLGFYSFGLSMAVFIPAETEAIVFQCLIPKRMEELNKKLESADTDIANKIGNENVAKYITAYKDNNAYIKAQAAKGMGLEACRLYLMKFLAIVYKYYNKNVTIEHIEKALQSIAYIIKNNVMDDIYDALDKINLMGDSPDNLGSLAKAISKTQTNLVITGSVVSVVTFIAFGAALKLLNVSNAMLKAAAEEQGMEWTEEDNKSIIETESVSAKIALGFGAALTVVSIGIGIYQIVEIVEQTKEMVDSLKNKMKPQYIEFYKQIQTSSKQYVELLNKYTDDTKQ